MSFAAKTAPDPRVFDQVSENGLRDHKRFMPHVIVAAGSLSLLCYIFYPRTPPALQSVRAHKPLGDLVEVLSDRNTTSQPTFGKLVTNSNLFVSIGIASLFCATALIVAVFWYVRASRSADFTEEVERQRLKEEMEMAREREARFRKNVRAAIGSLAFGFALLGGFVLLLTAVSKFYSDNRYIFNRSIRTAVGFGAFWIVFGLGSSAAITSPIPDAMAQVGFGGMSVLGIGMLLWYLAQFDFDIVGASLGVIFAIFGLNLLFQCLHLVASIGGITLTAAGCHGWYIRM